MAAPIGLIKNKDSLKNVITDSRQDAAIRSVRRIQAIDALKREKKYYERYIEKTKPENLFKK